MKKIFFSWQSDEKQARNKLKSALEIAAKRLGDQLVEADRPDLDSDTQGTFGSEDIAETIFKKIDEAAIFVGDVTPIASTENKLIPNPNVMTELGYALKSKGPNTRLFIFCAAENIEVNKMPFDIRGKSLYGFSLNDQPAKIADALTPILEGMLANVADALELEHPYVYIVGAAFHQWSNDTSAVLEIKNTESEEYFLEEIDVAGNKATPNRSLEANGITRGISILGLTQIFKDEKPLIKMTLTKGNSRFLVEQEIQTIFGADEQYHFNQFVQRPSTVKTIKS